MNNIINTALSSGGLSLGERLSGGLSVLVIGVAAVFGVLASLWGVLALFKIFFYDIPEKKKAKKAVPPAPAPAEEPAAPAPEVKASDDTQLIAVITAAIAAYRSDTEKTALPFRVVSFKRSRGSAGWNGTEENESF